MHKALLTLLVAVATASTDPLLAQTAADPALDAFRGITPTSGASTALTAPNPATYADRPDFSQATLSPQGSRVAMVVREAAGVTTVAVVDVSGAQAKPLMQLDVPHLLSVQSFGWASEDKLVAWLNIDTSYSSDDSPTPSLYIAIVDLKTKQVTERIQPNTMAADLGTQFPLTSDLVRAPWRDPNHVLISECRRVGGVKGIYRGVVANYTFVPDPPTSNRVKCELFDWNLAKNQASIVAKPIYATPVRFFANRNGDQITAEGRRQGGEMVYERWNAARKHWDTLPAPPSAKLLAEWDSSEEDYPQTWSKIHKLLGDNVDPAGRVVEATSSEEPLGIQFSSPAQRFVPLTAALQGASAAVENAFANQRGYSSAAIHWWNITDDRSTALLSADSSDNPGAYFIWRGNANTITWITDQRSLKNQDLVDSTLQTGWLSGDLPVAVTPSTVPAAKGLVLQTVVVADKAATDTLRNLDLTDQWFAHNGLTVVRVPVGMPADLSDAYRGDAWRRQVAHRITAALAQARSSLKLQPDATVCLYGREADAYAALAAAAYDSGVQCVVAINPRLSPKLFAQPFTPVQTTDTTWYVGQSNDELMLWRALYGPDVVAGTPQNWNFNAANSIFLAYDMYDQHRALTNFTADFRQRASRNGATLTYYTPQLDATKPDDWTSHLYDAMVKFLLPTDQSTRRKRGVITIEQPLESTSAP